MTSTLGYALLGLLSREPLTGYELATRMRTPIGYFWTAGHSQIYPELNKLERNGFTGGQVVTGPGPRPTRRYRMTEQGRLALRVRVTSPLELEPPRSEFLLRVFCLWLVDRASGRDLAVQYRDQHRARLAEYEQAQAGWATAPAAGSPRFASYATLQAGLSYERHVISYCDWLIGALDVG